MTRSHRDFDFILLKVADWVEIIITDCDNCNARERNISVICFCQQLAILFKMRNSMLFEVYTQNDSAVTQCQLNNLLSLSLYSLWYEKVVKHLFKFRGYCYGHTITERCGQRPWYRFCTHFIVSCLCRVSQPLNVQKVRRSPAVSIRICRDRLLSTRCSNKITKNPNYHLNHLYKNNNYIKRGKRFQLDLFPRKTISLLSLNFFRQKRKKKRSSPS